MALFPHVIDNRELDSLDRVIAPDGSHCQIGGEPHEGVEAVARYITSSVGVTLTTSANHFIETGVDDCSATRRGKFVAPFKDAGAASGDYHDVYVKLEDGWRIHSRRSDVRIRQRRR